MTRKKKKTHAPRVKLLRAVTNPNWDGGAPRGKMHRAYRPGEGRGCPGRCSSVYTSSRAEVLLENSTDGLVVVAVAVALASACSSPHRASF